MDRRVDDPTDSGLRLHTFGFDGQPAGDTSAFLRAVAVELPEARQDSAFHADVANADKLADAWSPRDESHLKGSNDQRDNGCFCNSSGCANNYGRKFESCDEAV